MLENESRFEQVMHSLNQRANVVVGFSDKVDNGQEGKRIERTYILVSPINPTEVSFEEFRGNLFRNEEGMYDWDRSNGRIFTSETEGNISKVVIIEMYPDTATAIASIATVK